MKSNLNLNKKELKREIDRRLRRMEQGEGKSCGQITKRMRIKKKKNNKKEIQKENKRPLDEEKIEKKPKKKKGK